MKMVQKFIACKYLCKYNLLCDKNVLLTYKIV